MPSKDKSLRGILAPFGAVAFAVASVLTLKGINDNLTPPAREPSTEPHSVTVTVPPEQAVCRFNFVNGTARIESVQDKSGSPFTGRQLPLTAESMRRWAVPSHGAYLGDVKGPDGATLQGLELQIFPGKKGFDGGYCNLVSRDAGIAEANRVVRYLIP